MKNQERLKQSRITSKSAVDDSEGQLNEITKRKTSQQKEISSVQKQISAFETKLEQKRADRHSLLKNCKVELPVLSCLVLNSLSSLPAALFFSCVPFPLLHHLNLKKKLF